MSSMRPDQAPKMREPPRLADLPCDYGAHTRTRADAVVAAALQREMMPLNSDAATRAKYAALARAKADDFENLKRVLETSNVMAQAHPIQDVPFFCTNIHFAARQTVFGADANYVIQTVDPSHVSVFRTFQVDLFDATAADDLFLSAFVNGQAQEGLNLIPVSSLPACCQNSYLKALPGQLVEVRIRNTNAIAPHDATLRVRGWTYTVQDLKETPVGIMPHTGT